MLTRLYVYGKTMLARLQDEKGATALEYGILVALIALVIVAGVTAFGKALLDFFNGIAAKAGLI